MSLETEPNVLSVLLAGGKGTRLRPFTAVLPKPLVPLGDKPIIEILLRRLAAHQLKTIKITTGYLSELIQAVCGDGSKFGVDVTYSKEDIPLGTAGPLGLISGLTDPTLVMNGDLLTSLNFSNLCHYHCEQAADLTIAIYRREVKIDFGVVDRDDTGAFAGFREKPRYDMDVSMGVNVLSSRAFGLIRKNEYLDMPDLILKVRDQGGKVVCYQEDCFWLDIGRMDDYARAQEEFEANEEFFMGAPE